MRHGTSRLWVQVPPNGRLNILGDVILQRRPGPELGELVVEVNAPAAVRRTSMTIGPVVVGGIYGTTFTVPTGTEFVRRLAPGTYKILFADFDVRNSRWEVEIRPGEATRVKFDVDWQIERATPSGS